MFGDLQDGVSDLIYSSKDLAAPRLSIHPSTNQARNQSDKLVDLR